MPRRALRRTDITRRDGENVLPRAPLLAVRHAIERHRLGEARIGVAAAAAVAQAPPEVTAAPQFERVAISFLLARFLGREPGRVFELWRDRRCCGFAHACLRLIRNSKNSLPPHSGGAWGVN